MENPRFCILAEVVPGDNKERLGGSSKNDSRAFSLSPPTSADDKGAPHTGCSTADGSVFTFNSVTDDSSDGKKSDPSSPAILDAAKETLEDKKSHIKMTIHKEYTFTIKYDYDTLLKKVKEINEMEEAEKHMIGRGNDEKRAANLITEGTSSVNSPSPCPNETPNVKGRFSSRMFRNIFSIVTSPLAEKRTMKGFIYNRHYKKCKPTSSSSSTGQQAKVRTGDDQLKQAASA